MRVLALRLIVEASPFGDINRTIATIIGIPMHHVGGTLPGMIVSLPAVYSDPGIAGDCFLYRDGHRAGAAAVYHPDFHQRLSGHRRTYFRAPPAGG